MPRAMWKGSIAFGLVTVPVSLYAETGRVGVGTIVLRQREHLAALEPSGEALVLTTMRFAHEIRSAKDLALPGAKNGYQAREMKLARQLIETLSAEWDPTEFKDTYT